MATTDGTEIPLLDERFPLLGDALEETHALRALSGAELAAHFHGLDQASLAYYFALWGEQYVFWHDYIRPIINRENTERYLNLGDPGALPHLRAHWREHPETHARIALVKGHTEVGTPPTEARRALQEAQAMAEDAHVELDRTRALLDAERAQERIAARQARHAHIARMATSARAAMHFLPADLSTMNITVAGGGPGNAAHVVAIENGATGMTAEPEAGA